MAVKRAFSKAKSDRVFGRQRPISARAFSGIGVGAERSLRRALEINPDHTETLLQYGSLHEALGRLEEGLRFKQEALARDPRSLVLVHIATSCFSNLDSAFPAFPTFLFNPMVGERARNVKPM
jgi:tetratricopeptide (TPR) repeat protein